MDFIDKIKELSAKIPQQLEHISTEEATKNALIMPFINALGYNVFDPTEVMPEFTADVGVKKGEKVDYAIIHEGKPIIVLECKTVGTTLADNHSSQLYRYFSVTEARIAILTNGTTYRFYTDLEAPNKMDDKPFLVFDMLKVQDNLVAELKKLSKQSFDLDQMLSSASELKYSREVKDVLDSQLKSPTADFVRFFVSEVYTGKKTQSVLEQFTDAVKKALNQFVTDKVNERLQSALSSSLPQDDDEPGELRERDRIDTTGEEVEGYHIVKAILGSDIDPDRITHRDTISYFGILLDDNNRKPICRLNFNSDSTKYVTFFDENKQPERVDIASLKDIYKHADKLRVAVEAYDN